MLDIAVFLIPTFVGAMYIATGLAYVAKGDGAWATVWLAYGVANFGLVAASQGGG